MRIIYAGTPEFAAIVLEGLLRTHRQALAGVYTQPDRPAGRGLKYRPSPVKVLALAHGIPLYQPQTLRDAEVQAQFARQGPDLLVVAAYGLLLPKPILQAPSLGCINVHPSLLPRWRGAAPIPWAIMAGDSETGVSIMQMNERLDAGPVLCSARCDILPTDTAQSLHDRLAKLGVETLLPVLAELQGGTARVWAQDEAQATYAPRIQKSSACLDWQRSSDELERQVRALNPWPVAWTVRDQQPLRVWQAVSLESAADALPGTVIACSPLGIDVATANGRLRLLTVQRPGAPASGRRLLEVPPASRRGHLRSCRFPLSPVTNRPSSRTGREAALQALLQVLGQGRALTGCLPQATEQLTDPRDRSLAQELCYGVLRWLPQLDALLRQQLNKPLPDRHLELRVALLLGLYQLSHTRVPAHAAVAETVALAATHKKSWAKGLINAVLRGYLRNRKAITANILQQQEALYAHPRWLIDTTQRAWPQDWDTLLQENNKRPPMTLRVNARRSNRSAYLKALTAAHIGAYAAPHASHGITLAAPAAVDTLPGFAEGLISVQDAAAQLATPLLDLRPGQRVLDACAAPGGKTAHLLESEPQIASLLAIDHDAQRLERVRATLERLRLHAELVCGDAAETHTWWDGLPFQRILLDAPCSATGVIRRHPDIKVLRRPGDIGRLVDDQRRLLEALWPLLARGGLLLYATCSVLPQENTAQVARFLAQHPDARERTINAPWGRSVIPGRQILPGADGMDGFFYALLEKQE